MSKTHNTRDSIEDILQQIADAYVKKAGMGETKHPSGKAPDGTTDADPGFRAQENSEDVRRVYSASPDEDRSWQTQDDVQPNVGVRQSATGEDPAHETDSVSMVPEDTQVSGKTSHPARADKVKTAAELIGACDDVTKLASAILDNFEQELKNANPSNVAGYMTAFVADNANALTAAANPQVLDEQTKIAQEAHGILSQTILEGLSLGHFCADYLDTYIKTAEEIAGDPNLMSQLLSEENADTEEEAEGEPETESEEEIPPELLLALLQQHQQESEDEEEEPEQEPNEEIDPELLALLLHLHDQKQQQEQEPEVTDEEDAEALRAALEDVEQGKTAQTKRKFKSAGQRQRYNWYRQIMSEYVNS